MWNVRSTTTKRWGGNTTVVCAVIMLAWVIALLVMLAYREQIFAGKENTENNIVEVNDNEAVVEEEVLEDDNNVAIEQRDSHPVVEQPQQQQQQSKTQVTDGGGGGDVVRPWKPASKKELDALNAKFKPDQAWNLTFQEALTFVKEDDALRSRMGLPSHEWGTSGGNRDVTRLVINILIKRWIQSQGPSFRIPIFLEINTPNPESVYFTSIADRVIHYNYEEKTGKNDLMDMSGLDVNNATVVLVPQTLEHVQDVQLAIREIAKHTARHGYVVAHMPFINRPHGGVHHFSQWTALGLASVFLTNGFTVEMLHTWGTDLYTRLVLVDRRWPNFMDYAKLPESRGQLNSERNRYAQVFVVAKKL